MFLADTVCCASTPATFAHRPGFSVLNAVRLHHVIGVNDSVASQWGPHTMEAFVSLIGTGARAMSAHGGRRPDRAAAKKRRRLFDIDAGTAAADLPDPAPAGPRRSLGVALPARRRHGQRPRRPGRPPRRRRSCRDVVSKLPFVHIHSGPVGDRVHRRVAVADAPMVLGGMVGAMLAVAGASYQGVFSNPLADPYLLGIASGAGLGATIVIVEGPALGHLPARRPAAGRLRRRRGGRRRHLRPRAAHGGGTLGRLDAARRRGRCRLFHCGPDLPPCSRAAPVT